MHFIGFRAYSNGRLRVARCLTWLVFAVLLATPNRPANAAELTQQSLFDPDRLIEIAVELPAEDWDKLCQQNRDIRAAFSGSLENPFTWFKGNITIDGVKIESVGIRKKGFIGSLDNQFPSLKVKFDEYVATTGGSGATCAAAFLLEIWNGSVDWKCGKFSLSRAIGCWDEHQLAAFQAWAKEPWLP